MKYLLAILLLLIAAPLSHADTIDCSDSDVSYSLPSGCPADTAASHPRLMILPSDIAGLATRATGSKSAQYAKVKTLASKTPSDYDDYYYIALSSALVCLIEDHEGNSYATYQGYLESAVDYLTGLSVSIGNSWAAYWNWYYIMAGMSFAYDWGYDYLNQTRRDALKTAILAWLDGWCAAGGHTKHTEFSNYFSFDQAVFGPATLAIASDVSGDEAVTHATHLNYAKFFNNLFVSGLTVEGISGGGWHEGWAYLTEAHLMLFPLLLKAWSTATEEDQFALTDVDNMCSDLAKYILYSHRPHDNEICRIMGQATKHDHIRYDYGDGNMYASNVYSTLEPSLRHSYILLANEFDDGYWQYIANQTSIGSLTYDVENLYDLLFHDTSLSATAPTSALAKSWHSEGQGVTVMREGFGSTSHTFAAFRNADYYTNHQHVSENSFVIHKYDDLAIQSGVYTGWGGTHEINYYMKAIAANTMLVYDSSESVVLGSTRDGGQIYSNDVEHTGLPLDIATTVYEEGNKYVYCFGDATKAYTYNKFSGNQVASPKISHFGREFVWVKDLDYFVTLDRVISTDSGFEKSWLLHSITEPALDGSESFACGDCAGDTDAGISESTDSTLVTITNGNGRLFCKTLLPTSPTIRKTGGSGYEFWVDDPGANYIGSAHDWYSGGVDIYDIKPGDWRVAIQPSSAALADVFLHVLAPTHSNTSGTTTLNRISNADGNLTGTNAYGVHIASSTTDYVVLFSSDDDGDFITNNVQYTITPASSNLEHLLFNMRPSQRYNITVQDSGADKIVTVAELGDGDWSSTDDGVLSSSAGLDPSVLPPPGRLTITSDAVGRGTGALNDLRGRLGP